MNDYTPFLKFKTGEIGALKALDKAERSNITPFFDLARPSSDEKPENIPLKIKGTIEKGVRKYQLNFKDVDGFYIDDYDIDDAIMIDGGSVYEFLVNEFSELPFIPVIGLDRDPSRVDVLLDEAIKSSTFALRVTREDFMSYELVEDDLHDLFEKLNDKYSCCHLIVDCRLCLNLDVVDISNQIIRFVNAITDVFDFEKVIIAGSSVSVSLTNDIVSPKDSVSIIRNECLIFNNISSELNIKIGFGDYTTVSPDYSDVNVPGAMLRGRTSPKIIYCYDNMQFFIRGGALEKHPRGTKQYDDMCYILINKEFYRPYYSDGDRYFMDKAHGIGVDAQPHSIVKYLVNAHITYMINDY